MILKRKEEMLLASEEKELEALFYERLEEIIQKVVFGATLL